MSVRRTLACLLAGAGLVAGSLVASAPPADAACTVTVTGSSTWVIDGSDTFYKYTGKPNCSRIEYWDATANVYGPNSTYRDYDYFWVGNGFASQKIVVDDYTRAGKYVFGSKNVEALNVDWAEVRVSGMPTPTIWAKYDSHARISGNRTGSKVRLAGSIKRYCAACVNGWEEGYTKRSGTVLLQRRKSDSPSWYTYKTLTDVTGSWSHTASLANKHYFRAVVKQNGNSWSATSNKIYR